MTGSDSSSSSESDDDDEGEDDNQDKTGTADMAGEANTLPMQSSNTATAVGLQEQQLAATNEAVPVVLSVTTSTRPDEKVVSLPDNLSPQLRQVP